MITIIYLDVAVREEVLHQRAVGPRHASVVDAKAVGQQLPQVARLDRLRLGLQNDRSFLCVNLLYTEA